MQSRSLYEVLAAARSQGFPALMVDVKCRSPRDGELISTERLEPYVSALIAGGVDALSTPTDPVYFDGSLEIAEQIRKLSPVPLMRKEFFDDVEQMDESVEAGFDAVQLSVSTLGDPDLVRALKARAEKLDLEVVLGVHNVQQLERAVELGAAAISINCRSAGSLGQEAGLASYGQVLASLAPKDVLVMMESAFTCKNDIAGAAKAGVDGVLMGTAIAKSSDPAAMLRSLRGLAQAWLG